MNDQFWRDGGLYGSGENDALRAALAEADADRDPLSESRGVAVGVVLIGLAVAVGLTIAGIRFWLFG